MVARSAVRALWLLAALLLGNGAAYVAGETDWAVAATSTPSNLEWANDVDDLLDRFDVDTTNTCFHPARPCELFENRVDSDTPTCQCPPGTGKIRRWNILRAGTRETADTRHECVRVGRDSGLVTSCEATYTYEQAYTTPDTTAPTATATTTAPTMNPTAGYQGSF